MIRHLCPACDGLLYSSSAAVGLQIHCEYCRSRVEVPAQSQSGPYRGYRPVRPAQRPAVSRISSLKLMVLLLAGAVGVTGILYTNWGRGGDPSRIPLARVVKTRDGGCEIRVPASWIERWRLYGQNELMVRPWQDDMCVEVRSEAKVLSGQAMTLEEYARLASHNWKHKLKDGTGGTARRLTVDGLPAVQYELSGAAEGNSVVCLLTLIEGRRQFHQIVAVTTCGATRNRSLLQQITESFREGQ